MIMMSEPTVHLTQLIFMRLTVTKHTATQYILLLLNYTCSVPVIIMSAFSPTHQHYILASPSWILFQKCGDSQPEKLHINSTLNLYNYCSSVSYFKHCSNIIP